jgi:hypothetical protein
MASDSETHTAPPGHGVQTVPQPKPARDAELDPRRWLTLGVLLSP